MAKEIPSVADLRRKSEVSDEEIEAATAAYLAGESAKPYAFKSGHTIDVAKAIEMHPQAKALQADEKTKPGLRRTMVKTAIVFGFPVRYRSRAGRAGQLRSVRRSTQLRPGIAPTMVRRAGRSTR